MTAMKLPIYLDYAATTPMDERVAEKMMRYLTRDGVFGNPASRSHQFGWQAEEAVDVARNQIADLIGAEAREIIFTSGATESVNLAIKGIALTCQAKGKHIITCQTEHKAVLDTCLHLHQLGFDITYLAPLHNGMLDLAALRDAIRADTILVSIMHVNNETGVVQDIAAIGAICRAAGVVFHTDATQSVGKLALDLRALDIDLLSFSAHKLYGPKGIGVLYIRSQLNVTLTAQIHGGGQERGMRSGTLPVHQIVGMGEACALANQVMAEEMTRIAALRQHLWHGLSTIEHLTYNSVLPGVPTILNIALADIDGDLLIVALQDLAISSASACAALQLAPSHVLCAMGLGEQLALNSLRFSLGRFTTLEEIDFAIKTIRHTLSRLRAID